MDTNMIVKLQTIPELWLALIFLQNDKWKYQLKDGGTSAG